MAESPKVLIIAGPNGAGKTTFATEYLPNEANCLRFVNADLIAAGLSPFNPEAALFRAGRLMIQMIDELTRKGESFAIETTMSGRLYRNWISSWKTAGYFVEIHFLRLNSSVLAINRVAGRVRAGGHNVQANVIRRRFTKGWDEFEMNNRGLVDDWTVYDTSSVDPIIVEEGRLKRNHESGSEKGNAARTRRIESAMTAMKRASKVAHRKAFECEDKIAISLDGKVVWIDPIIDR